MRKFVTLLFVLVALAAPASAAAEGSTIIALPPATDGWTWDE